MSEQNMPSALRAEPGSKPDAGVAVLTTDEIIAIARQAFNEGRMAWAGFTMDEQGIYAVPVLSQMHFDLARAIETELTRRFRAPGGITKDES